MSGLRKALEIGRVNLVRQFRDRGDLFFVLVLPTLIIVTSGKPVVAPVTDAPQLAQKPRRIVLPLSAVIS